MDVTQEQMAMIEQLMPGYIAAYRFDGDKMETLYRSPNLHVLNGMTKEEYDELTGENAANIVLPDDLPGLMSVVRHALQTKEEVDYHYRVYHKTRGFDWVHVFANYAGECRNAPVLVCVFTNAAVETDIYQELLEHSSSIIYVSDCNTRELLYMNRAAQEFSCGTGFFTGHSCYGYVWGNEHRCANCLIEKCHQDKVIQLEWHNKKNNRWFNITGKRILWCGHDSFVHYIDDITEIKRLQQIVIQAEQRYELAVNGARLGVWEYHIKEHRVSGFSKNFHQFGISQSIDNVPESILTYFPQQEHEHVRNLFKQIEAGEPLIADDFWVQWPDLAPRCYHVVISVFKDARGEPSIAYGLGQNVTLMKLAEQTYHRSLQHLLTVNPKALGTYYLNITQNICVSAQIASEFLKSVVDYHTVDSFVDGIAALINDPAGVEQFRARFNRDALMNRFNRGETQLSSSYCRREGNKANCWVTTYANLLKNPQTEDIEAIIYSVDTNDQMTDRLIMQKLADTSYDMLILVNVEQKTLQVRSTSSQIVNLYDWDYMASKREYTVDFIINEAISKWIYPDDKKAFKQATELAHVIDHLKEYDYYDFSVRGYQADGSICSKRFQYHWLDETKKQILCKIVDITPIYEAHQSQLQQEQQLRQMAVHENEMKTRYVSDVSHDMRTPLNGIMGYLDLALANKDPEAARQYLKKARKSSDVLLQLINDTLDLSRLANGTLTFHKDVVYMKDIVETALTMIKPQIKMNQIHFSVHYEADDTLIVTDPIRVNGILMNLLSNAAKFTRPGGEVELAIDKIHTTEDTVQYHIMVRDTGVGMSQEFLKRIYEPFTQERTKETAGITGSGLGLSIVKQIIEIMNGSISVTSKMGKGTVFTLEIPFTLADGQPPVQESVIVVDKKKFQGKKILLCDDNAMNRDIASTILESLGMIVATAKDGEECVQDFCASAVGEFDLILMDIRMPVMNGYESTGTIRRLSRPDAAAIPIVAMSADAYPEDVKRCLEAGMDAHIAKPIDTGKMLTIMYQLICL